ncbi:Sodium transporter HKT1 [Apostasia shenzhenica]|uniref:Sodium transporter HKT1 n=1 Tax=Apostasia shenzhenica TaxID=1088818 RepID=A0A2I0BH13_9ASPA|nr:Sodium transporter HKT1 [Apostasia shenzhenica]
MISQLSSSFHCHFLYCYRFLLSHGNSLSIHILYYLSISFLGFLALKSLNLRNPSSNPSGIDFFFTSVSAATVSSMSVVEMEVFSNSQLIVLMLLMFIGGEVFTCMIGLKSVRILAYSVMGYLLLTQVGWSLFILLYINCVSSVRGLLKKKQIDRLTFSIFAAISSFANCGFLPTNESMMAFRKNSGLLLLMMPLLLIGNTLFPLCLRGWLWALKKATKKEEFGYLLMENTREVDYDHLLPRLQWSSSAQWSGGLRSLAG